MFFETRRVVAFVSLFTVGWASPSSATLPEEPSIQKTPAHEAKVGINIGGVASWSPQVVFVDAIMRARPWIPFPLKNPGVWDARVPIPMDRHKMPVQIPFRSPKTGEAIGVRTLIFDELDGNYPAGTYVVSFEGSGEVRVAGDPGFHKFKKPGRHPISVTPGKTGWILEIHRSSAKNPVRNLHVWLPGFENAKDKVHPMAVYRLKGFSVLRAMQTMATNTGSYPCHKGEKASDPNCVNKWSDRTTPDLYTQSWSRGMALEYVIEIANKAGSDFWPGIPHAADDEWIRNAATMIRDRLDPKLKVYVELSNETWNDNWLYPQSAYFKAVGKKDKLFAKDKPNDEREAGRRAFVRRSVQVYTIFEEVFGKSASTRVVKVMPAFFGWSAVAESLMKNLSDVTLNPTGMKVDAIAVGAYFGAEKVADEDLTTISTSRFLDALDAQLGSPLDPPVEGGGSFVASTKQHALIAQRYNVDLIAYEGGQHLAATHLDRHSPVHEIIHEANRSDRMGKLYNKMFEYWYGAGGKLFVGYIFVDRSSQWGAFGHLEHSFQPLELAPKFEALRTQVAKSGGKMNPPVNIDSVKRHLREWRRNPAKD